MEYIEKSDDVVPFKYTNEEEYEMMKKAVAQINIHVFVYNITLKEMFFFTGSSPIFGVLNKSEYSVIGIINLNIIDLDSIDAFQKLFDDIEKGEENSGAIIKIYYNSQVMWYHIVLANCFNEKGEPIHAIGTIQDVSNKVEIELSYSKEKQFRLAMLADSRRVYEINVTRDRFIRLESIQDTTDCGTWSLYTESMANLCKTQVFKDDWDAFLKIATRENLIRGFKDGTTEFYCEYRTIDEEGHTSWASSSTHLLRDPLTDDIKGFIYVKDIDAQKRQELSLCHQAERDPPSITAAQPKD